MARAQRTLQIPNLPPTSSRALGLCVLMCGMVAGTWGSSILPDPSLVPVLWTPLSSGAPSHPGGIWSGTPPFRGEKVEPPSAHKCEQFEKAFSSIPT